MGIDSPGYIRYIDHTILSIP